MVTFHFSSGRSPEATPAMLQMGNQAPRTAGITLHGLTVARRVRRWRGTPAAHRSPPGSSGLTAASASPARLP